MLKPEYPPPTLLGWLEIHIREKTWKGKGSFDKEDHKKHKLTERGLISNQIKKIKDIN